MFHLGVLRLIQGRVRRREVRAGVRHGRAQPQGIELVTYVVVMMNVFARAMQRIGRPPVQPLPDASQRRNGIAARAGRALIQHLDEPAEIAFDLDLADAVQLAELQIGIPAQTHQRGSIRNVQGRHRVLGADALAIPDRQLNRRIAECM